MKNIKVKVKPNARQTRLELLEDGTWIAQLKSAPVDGKANEELIGLIAKQFNCKKREVVIKTGAFSQFKIISIPDEED